MERKIEYFNSVYKEGIKLEFKFQKYYCVGTKSDKDLSIMITNNYDHNTQMINNTGLTKQKFLNYFLNYGVELDIKEIC